MSLDHSGLLLSLLWFNPLGLEPSAPHGRKVVSLCSFICETNRHSVFWKDILPV